MRWRPQCAATVVGAILATLAITPVVHSQSARPIFGLRPSLHGKTTLEGGHFQYAVKAGTSVEDSVEVVNLSPSTLRVQLYAADMRQAADGALTPSNASDPKRTVGKWLELQQSSVTIPPEESRYVTFAVTIPSGTRPGDHVGAVVGSVRNTRGAGNLTVESRVALIARVRIPGEPHLAAAIGALAVSGRRTKTFEVELRNSGNLLFTPKGNIDISDGTKRIASLALSPADVYLIPNGKARFRATWSSAPLFGSVEATASFELTSPEEQPLRFSGQTISLRFLSWPIVWLAIAVLSLGGLVIWRRRRIVRTTGANPVPSRDRSPGGVLQK